MAISAKWHHRASTDVLQRSSHTVDVVGGNAYIFGGELLPRKPRDNKVIQVNLNHLQAEPRTGPFSTKTSTQSNLDDGVKTTTPTTAPPARVGAASTVLNGKVYLFSGRGGEAMTPIEEEGALWVFDPSMATWSLLTPAISSDPFPQARSYHCATSDGDHCIFIHAGCPVSGRLSDLWSFDVTTRKWVQLADAPAPARGGTSIAFIEGRLYRMNGFDGSREQGAMIDVYQPSDNTWDFKPFSADGHSGPSPRSVAVLLPLFIDGNPMLVTLFGEGDPSALGHAGAGKMFNDIWVYDISTENWSKVDAKWDHDRVPAARGWFDAAVVNGSTIFLAGGLGEDNERLQDSWILQF